MQNIPIAMHQEKIAQFCGKHPIKKLPLFGSVPRDDFRPDSDVDVLVEFEKGHTSDFALITIQDELSELLGGRKVDLVTLKFLNRRIHDNVEQNAKVAYI